jgi:DNA-binding IclR family transcriptional regulator
MGGSKALVVAGKEALGPRSLFRLLGLFDALSREPEGLTLAQLNAILKSPKSSLLNLLRPLVAADYLGHYEGRYRLGASIFRLAAIILSGWSFSKVFRPFLEELATRSQESVYLGVLDRQLRIVTYVDVIDSVHHSVRFAVPVGGSRPLYCTSSGRALLAFTDPDWAENYVRTMKLEPRTPHTLVDRKALRSTLENIRKTGISVCIGEMSLDSAGISVPIFGADGKVIAVMAIGAPSKRLRDNLPALRELITEVARRASGVVSSRHGGVSSGDASGAGIRKGLVATR